MRASRKRAGDRSRRRRTERQLSSWNDISKRHELGSRRRQLEAAHRQGKGEVGRVQERYGLAEDEAERQVKESASRI